MAENQYVVFKLGKGEFGIDIMNVKEISSYEEAISLPNTPSFIEGVINYRGNVIPIINLKKRLSLGEFEVTKDTRIIVINLDEKEIGFIVDEASQTLRVNNEQIDPAPSFISGVDKKYITGVGKLDEKRLLILIDLKKILSADEIEEIQKLEV
ncbi:chemotaxis protein CheW [Tissierella praeacuta]|uniref:Purine-binding chemotaxis protein CheW n=1 Tax=Tissierella praeacuta DSM 18095 TaxID=1123404 RepID=A0A1M4YJD4_9FIRM|nr:chemotaxis protein CheW [Tissierella praeacuta]HAE92670.1 chemotaxis protein CheW [Tissierella sp.]MBU5255382.1 chemotaxis protein CheW [Tissierella praeacuta]TCU66390.1 purine-binding chemotaxis protein CheW [Tissierella praeacuta]SHF05763.1 purine-binding chemotaxis protein CheW [Tissierella praeacuta DSM 18095]SUP01967.1 Chemotaxis protein CheW [Tissierella praeacuta]